ncbi:MAG: VOC family protein [Proteobacteria bacterium]|nr:VOC family protein [Pseudomonadota bacterium]
MSLTLTGLTPLLSVWDMPEAIAFYCGKLGFEIVDNSPEIEAAEGRYFHWAWLRRGGAELMLNTAYDANERPPSREAADWIAHDKVGLYIGANPDEAYAELTGKGLQIDPPKVAPYGMKQLNLKDPNGYWICFQAPA